MHRRAREIGATEACPIFENLQPGPLVRAGALLEGILSHGVPEGEAWPDAIPVRLLDAADRIASHPQERNPVEVFGFDGYMPWKKHLKPLTRAAREMLALVRP